MVAATEVIDELLALASARGHRTKPRINTRRRVYGNEAPCCSVSCCGSGPGILSPRDLRAGEEMTKHPSGSLRASSASTRTPLTGGPAYRAAGVFDAAGSSQDTARSQLVGGVILGCVGRAARGPGDRTRRPSRQRHFASYLLR